MKILLLISNPKSDTPNIIPHTNFAEKCVDIYSSYPDTKIRTERRPSDKQRDGRMDIRQTDGHMDDQNETIILDTILWQCIKSNFVQINNGCLSSLINFSFVSNFQASNTQISSSSTSTTTTTTTTITTTTTKTTTYIKNNSETKNSTPFMSGVP